MTGVGEFSSDACRQVLAKITETQASTEMYNALNLGKIVTHGAKRCCPTTVVKSILQRLGLEVGKRKSKGGWLHSIKADDWSFITGYVRQRAAKGVHSLTTHEHPCPHEPRLSTDSAAPAVTLDARDTLQCGVIEPDAKYPSLEQRERIYAAARSAAAPLGNSLSRLIEELEPEVRNGFASDGADRAHIRFILQHVDRALAAYRD